MKKTCLLFIVLLLLGSAAACATTPELCNYERPKAVFNTDHYQCQMLAETKRLSTDSYQSYGKPEFSMSDCMAQLGWRPCRK